MLLPELLRPRSEPSLCSGSASVFGLVSCSGIVSLSALKARMLWPDLSRAWSEPLLRSGSASGLARSVVPAHSPVRAGPSL